jgi:hypothetical protein
LQRGLVHVTTITLLEAGYAARSAEDMGELLDRLPLSFMPVEHLSPATEKRAVGVLRSLADALKAAGHDGVTCAISACRQHPTKPYLSAPARTS